MSQIDLSGQWTLERTKDGTEFPAELPGDNYSALIRAGKMAHPYWAANELEAQWAGREDWAFLRVVTLGPAFLAHDSITLELESVDTVAEYWINGQRVGQSQTMFVPLRLEVRPWLKPGPNEIRIVLRSPELFAKQLADTLSYPIPHTGAPVMSAHRNLLRKAQCHSGWDWGPCLMVSGIAGRMVLNANAPVTLLRVWTETEPGASGRWTLRIFAEISAKSRTRHTLAVMLESQNPAKKEVRLEPGVHQVSLEITVESPGLWSPMGYGDQNLYALVVSFAGSRWKGRVGFRSLRWETKGDEWGKSLTCVVNGRPVFAKGANWIPADALPSSSSQQTVTRLLEDAVAANMNMIRVWGGGIYETDWFYQECDRLGLLVWQDFMFSCAMYPADPQFLGLVAEEVEHQVKRLKNHACLALFCGNNENLGARMWFQEARDNPQRYMVDYDRLNEGTVGRVVREWDGSARWWPSSPSGGVDDYTDGWHTQGRGDMHFWSVWHEGKSFDEYYAVTPRFCSEFGFQSFPWPSDVAEYAPEDHFNLTSPVMEHHQKNARGNQIILESFSRYFRIPHGFDNQLYLSQVQQAMAIQTAAEYWRARRPVNMGVLFWQLNDLWPVASWSSISYSGRWKLLHYAAKRFFEPIHISGYRLGDQSVHVVVTNDTEKSVVGTVSLSWLTSSGNELAREEFSTEVSGDSAREVKLWHPGELPVPLNAFLEVVFTHSAGQSRNTVLLVEPKKMDLVDPKLKISIEETKRGLEVVVTAQAVALWVTLDPGDLAGRFDDNGVTLLSGEQRRFLWIGKKTSARTLRRGLRVYDLFGCAHRS